MLIGDILVCGKVLILVGGIMMYFNVLINGILLLFKLDEKIWDEII